MRKTQEPEREWYDKEYYTSGYRETHPAYGSVRISRVFGSRNLFKSKIDVGGYVELTISQATLERHTDTHSEWIFPRNELVSVCLSSSQFGEMITTLNDGSGTPCTINHVNGEIMPGLSNPQNHKDLFVSEYEEKYKQRIDALRNLVSEMKEILDRTKQPSKKTVRGIVNTVERMVSGLESHQDFMKDCFIEDMEKIVSDCKAEVDSFATQTALEYGIQHLKNTKMIEE